MSSLRKYRGMRPEGASPEPRGGRPTKRGNSFVIQRHDATRLHYDLRLEMNGVLKSWAVPKGPALDPSIKRLAVEVEDHPLDYGGFEGTIPEGNYGAGEVILWDRGTYETEGPLPADQQWQRGEIKFILHGQKLNGGWVLVKLRNSSGKKNEWLLIKHRDENVRTDWDIEEHGKSVKSGKAPGPPRHSKHAKAPVILATGVQNLKNAKPAEMPDEPHAALASLSEKPFSSDDWMYEIKWDGIRALALIENGATRLLSRSGRSITDEYPEFSNLAKNVRARRAVLDGEIVVLDSAGKSDFQRLQSRFGVANPTAKLQAESPVTYYFFDVLYCDGYDVRRAPLIERKQLLERLMQPNERIRISQYQIGNGVELFQAAVASGLEGLVAKRNDSGYPESRGSSWLKFKGVREVDAVIGGWTDPRGGRKYFGSLLVGLYEKNVLKFVGGVGTGFPNQLEKDIFDKLQDIATTKCPFTPTPQTRERAHWVQPKLVARIGYAEWTSDQHLRQPRFLGLQPDRSAKESTFSKETKAPLPAPPEIGKKSGRTIAKAALEHSGQKNEAPEKDAAKQTSRAPAKANASAVATEIKSGTREQIRLNIDGRELNLTHLNKEYFPADGVSKRDVLAYYAFVAPFMLPFLKDRPMVLHRYPNGIEGGAFYQKEAGEHIPEWIRTANIYSEAKKHDVAYFLIDDLASLLYLTNLGCIEHNPFSARADDLEKPDYMFVDLDPTEGTSFSRVKRAAKVMGEVLSQAKLKFYLKTSGATGLHIFIPIVRNYGFDQIRALLEIMTMIAVESEKGLLTRIHRVNDRPKNTVFVDVRQNAYAQSLAAIFSLRPRQGAPVSTPLAWSELEAGLKPEDWNIRTVLEDLPQRGKLWKTFFERPQSLEQALAALERSRAK